MKTSLEIFAQNLRDTLEAQRKSQSDLARVTRPQKSKKAGLSPCLLLWRLYEEKEALCSFTGA